MNPTKYLPNTSIITSFAVLALGVLSLASIAPASDAITLNGQVLGGGRPITGSTVTLFAASASAPQELGHAPTDADGRFALNAVGDPGKDAILYLVAKGGTSAASKAAGNSPAIALMSVL